MKGFFSGSQYKKSLLCPFFLIFTRIMGFCYDLSTFFIE